MNFSLESRSYYFNCKIRATIGIKNLSLLYITMGKIGTYEYPEMQFGTLLTATNTLIEKFSGQANDEKTFAEAIGHTTNESGTFLMKLADLRKYGLLEKREIKATETAKRIVKPLSSQERTETLNAVIFSIPLWKELYTRLNSKNPAPDDFKIQLVELSGDRDAAISRSNKIRNLFVEAMSYQTKTTEEIVTTSITSTTQEVKKAPEEPQFTVEEGVYAISIRGKDMKLDIVIKNEEDIADAESFIKMIKRKLVVK